MYEVEINEIDWPLYLTEKQLVSLLTDIFHGDKQKVEACKEEADKDKITSIRTHYTRAVITRIEL